MFLFLFSFTLSRKFGISFEMANKIATVACTWDSFWCIPLFPSLFVSVVRSLARSIFFVSAFLFCSFNLLISCSLLRFVFIFYLASVFWKQIFFFFSLLYCSIHLFIFLAAFLFVSCFSSVQCECAHSLRFLSTGKPISFRGNARVATRATSIVMSNPFK